MLKLTIKEYNDFKPASIMRSGFISPEDVDIKTPVKQLKWVAVKDIDSWSIFIGVAKLKTTVIVEGGATLQLANARDVVDADEEVFTKYY